MATSRDLQIDYGGFVMGGPGPLIYEVTGPTSVGLSFDGISVSFDVIVTHNPGADFATAILALETALRRRDQSLVITVDGNSWGSWIFGQKALNTSCSIDKAGDIDSDTGASRVYSVTFEAGHAADDLNGLRSINASAQYVTSNQINVSIDGEYTALNGTVARTNYYANIAPIVQAILDLIDASATWEPSNRDLQWDRNNHVARFTEQYLQMIFPKSEAGIDHPSIKGHRVVFTRLSAYPGDSAEDSNRPETVIAEYSCVIDTEVVEPTIKNLSDLYEDTIFPFLDSQIRETWNPRSLVAVQNSRQFDGTSSAIMGNVTFTMYMPGSDILEKTESTQKDDTRNIDYTPVWDDDELAAYADQGHMIRMRSRVITETRFGIHETEPPLKPGDVRVSGWNVLRGANQRRVIYMGEGENRQPVTVLSTVLLERFTRLPGTGGGAPTSDSGGSPGFQGGGESVPTQEEIDIVRSGGSLLRPRRPIPGGRA